MGFSIFLPSRSQVLAMNLVDSIIDVFRRNAKVCSEALEFTDVLPAVGADPHSLIKFCLFCLPIENRLSTLLVVFFDPSFFFYQGVELSTHLDFMVLVEVLSLLHRGQRFARKDHRALQHVISVRCCSSRSACD